MAAAYRSSTSTSTGTVTASSLAVTVPSGVQVNDVLVAAVAIDGGTSASATAPSGWQLLQNVTQSTNTRMLIYFRVATGYEAASYTWSFDTSRFASAIMAAYSGAHPYAPAFFASLNVSTASTTIGGAAINSTYESGRGIQFITTRNTTAAATITPGSGYTKRDETSTTAGTFISLEIQDSSKTLPMGGLTSVSSTSSQSVTGICWNMFIEDARPAFTILGEEAFAVGSQSTSTTTTNISPMATYYGNTLLLAWITINKDVATVSSITGLGANWTLVSRSNTNAGSCELWRGFVGTTFSGQQAVVNYSGTITSVNNMFVAITGADFTGTDGSGAIGNIVTGTSTAAAPSVTLTTTRNNSWVWAAACQGNVAPGSTTAGSGQTLLRSQSDATNACGGFMWRQNNLTPTAGTNVTMNCTAPTNGNCNILAVEILPAVKKNLGTMGVG